MEFTVAQKDLAGTLQSVIGVVPQRSTLPILSYVLVEVEDGFLAIAATDLEVSILSKVGVNVSEPGGVTVPGKKFAEVIRELPDIPLRVRVDGEMVTISSELGIYRMMGLPKDEFPRLPEDIVGDHVEVEGSRFKRMTEKTVFAASKDETRPALNGLLWQIRPEEMRMVATDGHRLAKIVSYLEGRPGLEREAIIPSKAVAFLNRLVSGATDLRWITVGENHIVFDLGNTVLFSRLIEGPFPPYEEVIPQNNEKRLIVDKELLSSSLRRVSILSDSVTHQVRFSLQVGKIKLSAMDQEIGGEAEEEIAADYRGEEMDIGYNASYVLEILRQMDGDQVIFDLGFPLRAGIVHPAQQAEGEDYFCLIMPIRLSD